MFLFRARILTLSLIFLCVLGVHSAAAFTVTPAIQEVSLRPGESRVIGIKITNNQNRPRAYVFSIQKFIPKGSLGQQEFLPLTDTSGLPEWMYVSQPVLQIGANQSATMPVQITIPADAKAGGHYAALFISEQVDTAGAMESVSVLPRTGVLFLVTVNGDLIQNFNIASLVASPQTTNRLPISLDASVENVGNVHLAPSGEVRIQNMFGQTVAKYEVNASGARVLPSSSRLFQVAWNKVDSTHISSGFFSELKKEWLNFAVGRYESSLSLHANGVEKTQSVVFYVWPWRLMSLVGLTFIVLVTLLVLWFRRYRRSLLVG